MEQEGKLFGKLGLLDAHKLRRIVAFIPQQFLEFLDTFCLQLLHRRWRHQAKRVADLLTVGGGATAAAAAPAAVAAA
eukprot:CAMPEP_0172697098 /NCGR_PEP_ID=MMETSP1074-20121228/28513_1 /TAXON_ID=2916 /ORGANISM="Ceratium fusus, Strain PA161109" /LENGTH=76 /DNA_ID=CAMNT_0013517943 /DNA_START=264 /DNA_END=490 /DNA_ORIENTATION=+